ncbi:hypothetical protein NG895_21080 [Aeoliella sp. ICT_H6.2]|uniref:Uncharacterized protein n=1 Tax=Aeoliella straminimaris TaxID=2954799 RepID=A0A9X2FGZ7_9BACT|nr:hypothetical protein [Aeoliella straminimaris]MCO6046399.1 hypothetical protein [Aeoliella straminimaris]
MNFWRTHLLRVCLVWATALGLSLSVFATRPPCACSLERPQPEVPACPHCAQASHNAPASPDSCCQQGCHSYDDCECPCCNSTPADQPLRLDSASEPQLVPLSTSFFTGAVQQHLLLANPIAAAASWRSGQFVGYEPPRLAKLCRWII